MRNLRLKDKQFGDGQRLLHQENELEHAPIVPIPVEYGDIDSAMIRFFDAEINMTDDNGEKVPIFKLLSNQRFTEYTQTWKHTDKDGNLLMNFKTINRDVNPSWGTIHSGMANIPGDNRFTVLMREIVDDTGVECYEVTSMSQPLSVDLKYTVTFITSKLEKVNEFNMEVIKLFKSKQCYIYPNGHAMPMVLDSIGDDSNYEIDGRKFYNQSVIINVMGYVIPKDDIKVELKPKRKSTKLSLDSFKKTRVDMDFDDEESNNFNLNIRFKPGVSKVSFSMQETCSLKLIDKTNANKIQIKINDDIVDVANFIVNADDTVSIKIIQPALSQPSHIIFEGIIIESDTF